MCSATSVCKGADFSNVSLRRIRLAESWINNYPRRILAGLSANSVRDRFSVDN